MGPVVLGLPAILLLLPIGLFFSRRRVNRGSILPTSAATARPPGNRPSNELPAS